MTIKKEEYHSKYTFIDKIVKRGGWLSLESKNYKYREGQVKMIDTILDGIDQEKNVVVEAPTGTGKSFAYLLATMDKVIHQNKRVAICTNTINLQEQLLGSDLPFLSSLLYKYKNSYIKNQLLKGKSNYVCEKKIAEFEKEGIEVDKKEEIDYIKEAIRWNKQTETGDKSEAPTDVLKVWDKISADQHCDKNCKHEGKCAFKAARAKARTADIVVLNHHTFIMDYMVKEKNNKGFLGEFDIVVFDEGHHLEKVAIEAFGKQLSYYSTVSRINSTIKALKKEIKENPSSKELLQKMVKYFITIRDKMDDFWDYLNLKIKDSKNQKMVLPHYKRVLDKKQLLLMKKVFESAFKLYGLLVDTGEGFEDGTLFNNNRKRKTSIELSEKAHEKLLKNLKYLHSNYNDFLLIIERQMKKEYAYWLENEDNPTLVAKPIDISKKLSSLYDNLRYKTPDSLIFTSATITTNKEFRFFIKNLGLPKDTITKIVKSPFDYKKQARLYVPKDSLSGTLSTKNPDQYQKYIAENVINTANITQRGIFALFTSYRSMEGAYEKVKDKLPFHNLLIQGSMNKQVLLEKFKNSKNSILFATYSFWEGVDVKGDDLGYVIIDKIPFDVHTDPLISAKRDKMKAEGDNFFNDYYVPEAIIKLKQGFGRLIRTKDDYGAVIILDDRMIPGNKRYSKKIYNSFPDIDDIFTRDFEEIKQLETRRSKDIPISKIG